MIPNEVRWKYHTFRGEMNTLLLHKELMVDSGTTLKSQTTTV